MAAPPSRPGNPPSLMARALSAARTKATAPRREPSSSPEVPPVRSRAAPADRIAARDLRWPGALALLLALGPALTWACAAVLEHRARADVAALAPAAEPLLARARAAADTRVAWAPQVERPTLGTTLERLATTLPAEDRLARVSSDPNGTLEVAILTADPDALRDALRREPVLAQLREAGQQRDEAVMRVTLRGRPQ
ncbi:hypothetical protein GCM10009095_13940 [Sphingomonas molluscorum]|nr:hypothetical protein GCM10017606_06210 [Microbacterium terregens]